MKKLQHTITVILALCISFLLQAQAPLAFNYQAVARDNSGGIIKNQQVVLRMTIHSATAAGPIIYQETHATTTNPYGLINIEIGKGSVFSGDFDAISWGADSHFLQVEIDPAGGSTYIDMGTSQLISVPYALSSADGNWTKSGNDIYNQNSGNVGIGITTPSALLDVGADARINGITIGRGSGNIFTNTVVGESALVNNTTGIENSAFGLYSLQDNTTGNGNSAFGDHSLASNTTGEYNSAFGRYSLYSNTIGDWNSAFGLYSLANNTNGKGNSGFGQLSLGSNVTGGYNSAFGYYSLTSNTTGDYNSAFGIRSLQNNTIGRYNSAFGSHSLRDNTTGNANSAFGERSLANNTTGDANSAFGNWSLRSNTTGDANSAFGHWSLRSNTTGFNNSAFGSESLRDNTNGVSNSAFGDLSLASNTGGESNSAFGYRSLASSTTGKQNSAFGISSLRDNTTGEYNVAVGGGSLLINVTGGYNTAVGNSASSIGSSYSNTTGLGYNADPTATNRIHVGNTSVTSIRGQVSFTTYSDERFKRNITTEVIGLEFIKKLRPVTYNLDIKAQAAWTEEQYGEIDTAVWEGKYDIEDIRFSGFIAQEVEQAALESSYDFSGIDKPQNNRDTYGLRYADFVVPLVKALQEQQLMIDELIVLVNQQTEAINSLRRKMESLR